MKKIFALLLSLTLLLGLCGCVSNEPDFTAPPATTNTSFVFEEAVLVDNEQCKFIIKSAPYSDPYWGKQIKVYIENNSDSTLMFATDKFSINGYMVSVLFATEVTPGKKENSVITIFSEDLEANSIEDIENIEFELTIYDVNNMFNEDIVKDFYTVNFNKE